MNFTRIRAKRRDPPRCAREGGRERGRERERARARESDREGKKASERKRNRDRDRDRKSTRVRESTIWHVQMLRLLDTECRKPQVGWYGANKPPTYVSVYNKPLLQAYPSQLAQCARTLCGNRFLSLAFLYRRNPKGGCTLPA